MCVKSKKLTQSNRTKTHKTPMHCFTVLLLPLPVCYYCQTDLFFSLPFYLLHLSLCTPGRGSGAFCLVMWAELWVWTQHSKRNSSDPAFRLRNVTGQYHKKSLTNGRRSLSEITWLTPFLLLFISNYFMFCQLCNPWMCCSIYEL